MQVEHENLLSAARFSLILSLVKVTLACTLLFASFYFLFFKICISYLIKLNHKTTGFGIGMYCTVVMGILLASPHLRFTPFF